MGDCLDLEVALLVFRTDPGEGLLDLARAGVMAFDQICCNRCS
jgi:hypothetical protein